MSKVRIAVRIGSPNGRRTTLYGRDAWALLQLAARGAQGCTPIDTPGPRWSSYVHKLRNAGIAVDTIREPHRGAFPGTHARYVLRTAVFIEQGGEVVA